MNPGASGKTIDATTSFLWKVTMLALWVPTYSSLRVHSSSQKRSFLFLKEHKFLGLPLCVGYFYVSLCSTALSDHNMFHVFSSPYLLIAIFFFLLIDTQFLPSFNFWLTHKLYRIHMCLHSHTLLNLVLELMNCISDKGIPIDRPTTDTLSTLNRVSLRKWY